MDNLAYDAERPVKRGKASELFRDIQASVDAGINLLALEGRLAVTSLVVILALAITAGGLLLSTWLLMCLALAYVLVVVELLSWGYALLTMVVINMLLLTAALMAIYQLSKNLSFPVCREYIFGNNSSKRGHE